MTRIGSLFSGYSGLDMAVRNVFGGELAWVSDIDPGACKILAHHHPDVPNLGDITAVDWETVEPVDILTGGFPCQDVSAAGRRIGLIRYGDTRNRSGLWAEMAGAIDAMRPRLVIAENVRGILSAKADAHPDVFDCLACMADTNDKPMRALGAVLGDLAAIGYDAAWHGIRASDIGAPHQRFRVFVVAWPNASNPPIPEWRGPEPEHLLKSPTAQLAVNGGSQHPDKRKAGGHGPTLADEIEHLLPTPEASEAGRGPASVIGGIRPSGARRSTSLGTVIARADWGVYEPAVRRWETITRPAPALTELSSRGGQRLSPAFVEWMQGLPAGHVTGLGLSRNDELKVLGNGVVPQQAEAALRYLFSALEAA